MRKRISFREAISIANRIGIAEEKTCSEEVILVLNDGSRLIFHSEYQGPYSPDTPGDGIEPPTCYHEAAEAKEATHGG